MTGPRAFSPADLERLAALHREVDEQSAAVADIHRDHLVCRRGCCECCSDGLTVLEIEAAWILAHRDRWDRPAGGPHPPGKCAFLAPDGACRIYRWRPYICRTQGLPLRWLGDDAADPGEGRSICPLNEREFAAAGISLADLKADSMWTLGGSEGRLASLQAEASGSFRLVRLPLRGLWD